MNLGIINISDTLMHQLRLNKDIDMFRVLYYEFFPCAINYNQFDRMYEVLGYCNEFKSVIEGEVYPVYEAVFTEKDGIVTVKFKMIL